MSEQSNNNQVDYTDIGFAREYYTLWWIGKPYKHYYSRHCFEWRQDRIFIKNISKSLDKVKELYPGMEPDYDLKGTTCYGWSDGRKHDDRITDFWQYAGKLGYEGGEDWVIPVGTDVRQLEGTEEEIKVLAKMVRGTAFNFITINIKDYPLYRFRYEYAKMLVKWGHWLEVKPEDLPDWVEPMPLWRENVGEEVYYITAAQAKGIQKWKDAQEGHGHHKTDGLRVELVLAVVKKNYFETQWGGMYIITYKCQETGELYVYKGGTMPQIYEGEPEKVKATIKHDEYKGKPQTRLQRIKVL